MKKFKNSFDYDPSLVPGEINDLPSMTVPDMTLSLKELLQRSVRGVDVPTFPGTYQEDDDFDERPDISKMDTMEKLQYAAEIRQGIAEWQIQIAEAKKQAEADKKAAALEAAKPKPAEEKPAESNNPT